MATSPDPREEARRQLLEYIFNQGVLGYQFPSYDTTYLGDVGKLYEDYALQEGMYDSVTPKYRALGDNPRALMMRDYFIAISNGVDPDQIIQEHNDKNALNADLQLNKTEEGDLKKFATEQATRAETMNERSLAASYYGIPQPTETWEIPKELVSKSIAQKTGLTQAQAAEQEFNALNDAYVKMMAGKPKQTTATVNTTDFDFGVDPAAWAFNKLVGAAQKVNPIVGRLPGINDYMSGQNLESAKISRNVEADLSKSPTALRPDSPRPGATGAALNALESLASASRDYEDRLTMDLATELERRFGTPYAAAAKEAKRIVASRKKGASGEWLE